MHPMGTWLGVDVNSAGRVVRLDLHSKGIKCQWYDRRNLDFVILVVLSPFTYASTILLLLWSSRGCEEIG